MGRNKSGIDEFLTGLVLAGVFGFLWFRSGFTSFWWIFPMAFAGLMPMLVGLRKIISKAFMPKADRQEILEQQKINRERQILQVARQHNGIVTPAIAALDSGMSMEETDAILGEMAKKGYAQAEVEDNGRLVYIFPDFKNQIEE